MKKIKLNRYIVIGITIILLSIIGGNYKLLLNYFNDKQEEKMIQEFYQDDLSNEETEQENIENSETTNLEKTVSVESDIDIEENLEDEE